MFQRAKALECVASITVNSTAAFKFSGTDQKYQSPNIQITDPLLFCWAEVVKQF